MGLGFFSDLPCSTILLDEENDGNYTAWFSQVYCIRRSQKRIFHPSITVLAAYTICGLACNNLAISLTALMTLRV